MWIKYYDEIINLNNVSSIHIEDSTTVVFFSNGEYSHEINVDDYGDWYEIQQAHQEEWDYKNLREVKYRVCCKIVDLLWTSITNDAKILELDKYLKSFVQTSVEEYEKECMED